MLWVRVFHIPLTSSRDRACLNTLTVVLVPTKGSVLRLRTPTLATVSLRDRDDGHTGWHQGTENTNHTPRNSMGTSRQNAFLKRDATFLRLELEDLYNLYAKEICSRLSFDSKPTWLFGLVRSSTTNDQGSPCVAFLQGRERCKRHGRILSISVESF